MKINMADDNSNKNDVTAETKEEPKEDKKVMPKVSKKLEDLIGEVEELSVLELSELVKALEVKFGVSAAPQVAVKRLVNKPLSTSFSQMVVLTKFRRSKQFANSSRLLALKKLRIWSTARQSRF
ncbi:MAG: 50S ribosomal protein L7/L12 [Candidatus Curtissbacteria bacterium GW2011_GWA1_41_11]|uniref:50S ribosomal protein L7/L12 n=1 Tax=Candidatus Curtissbacteria bacterium GW2011_GWA1_41_11 TaxID=1618409 RepID=A0A0G0UKC5_9BACT|nr:MAG: 50S ribosomal protein L7/L12 [Candidatus Curtissbacteria bacterium GW2011_GWA1_41_11]